MDANPAIRAKPGTNLQDEAARGEIAPLIAWLRDEQRELGRGERRMLASLLAGELRLTGRPRKKEDVRREYDRLIVEGKEQARACQRDGIKRDDALEMVAKNAAKDPRARNCSWTTIKRDLEDAE